MMRLIMNIGYVSMEGAHSTMNDFPMAWEFETIHDCFEWLRTQMFTILTWAKNWYIPKSMMCLFLRIENDVEYWEYKIMCKNIREYKAFMSFTDEEIEAKKRENNINSILE